MGRSSNETSIGLNYSHIGGSVKQSWIAADLRGRVARYPVQEEGGQTSLEQDRAPRDEVRDGLSLLLPGVPG